MGVKGNKMLPYKQVGCYLSNNYWMELDYIENINEFGENVVRLYNFDKSQAIKFRDLIKDIIVNRKQKLTFHK